MKTMLVPVDGSENALNAAHYAADMALAIDADIHLLHVVQIVTTPAPVPAGYVFEDLKNAGRVLLDRMTADLTERTHRQVAITSIQGMGSIDLELETACERLRPFVIIMGAPHGQFARTILGSPALNAARRLPYPVLVIPKHAIFQRIRRIAIACQVHDYASPLPVTVSFLKQLQSLFDARIDLFHIVEKGDYQREVQTFGLYRWQKHLDEVQPDLHFVKSDSVEEGIAKFIADHRVDWLIMFPEKHGLLSFHHSHSKRLLGDSPVPVISISEPASKKMTSIPIV